MKIVTRSDHPELRESAASVFRERWPEFIFHDDVPKRYMGRVQEYFARYDIMALSERATDEGTVVAGGWGVPIAWDGSFRSRRYSVSSVASARGWTRRTRPD